MKNKKILLAIIPVILVMTAISVIPALATYPYPDPAGCYINQVGLGTTAFRVDGTTPIGGGTVHAGETIKYQLYLNALGYPSCNFYGGIVHIILPNGTQVDVTPVGGISLVSLGNSFSSALVPYVVKSADANAGYITAYAHYENGISLMSTPSSAGATTNSQLPFQAENLTVTKTAVPAEKLTYIWTIDKSVTPTSWNLFNGDTGTSEYTVSVVKTLSGTTYGVTGIITITNPSAFISAHITGVTDVISPSTGATVDCGGFPFDLAPGAHIDCAYNATLPDSTTRLNNATVSTTGDINGGSGTASVDFTGITPTVIGGSINVDDTYNGGTWAFSNSGSVKYSRTFDCSGLTYTDGHASYAKSNTATIRGTALSDSATVNVDCYKPLVTKTAVADFNRSYTWNILKSGPSSLTVDLGQTSSAAYTVTVTKSVGTDSNVGVTGTITVHNPAPIAAIINSVSDVISGPITATVDCGATEFPYTLAAGQDLVCTYSADLPNTNSRTNTATATIQNLAYDTLDPANSGTTDFTGTAPVTFGDPTSVKDNCIDVSDTLQGTLGNTCASKVFTYSRTVGPFAVCGPQNSISNTASFITSDTETTGNSSWTVNVNVPCPVDDRFMTGGGSINPKTARITHGFELHCDPTVLPNNLEINWGKGNNFHLTSLTTVTCFMDESLGKPNPPKASFNTYVGTGTGLLNGVAGAKIEFTFTDVGEPGKKDTATYKIWDKNNNLVQDASGSITSGNQQAHGSFTPAPIVA